METCAEDDEIALRMDAGRRALAQRGDDERGPYQSPMEDGMHHFHEWYRKGMAEMAPTLPTACGSLDESPPEAAALRPVQACAGRLGAAGLSPEGAAAGLGRPGAG